LHIILISHPLPVARHVHEYDCSVWAKAKCG
jgi:hypothetical protein